MIKQFAVFGNPIAHSQSPSIHLAFAEQFKIALNYEKIFVNTGEFTRVARAFFQRGVGANVTVPFKEEALLFADTLSQAAQLAGAVNTLSLQQGKIVGDNTDGIGLVNDIRDNHQQAFADKKVLIIGAGGAARGVILPIAQQAPQSITLVNRTAKKAVLLAQQFSPHVSLQTTTFEQLNTAFDIVINATSAALSGQSLVLSPHVIQAQTFAYDMMYGINPTTFMQWAENHGATTSDGLGMLVEQAAASFAVWHGVKPQTQCVIAMIRRQLQSHH